MDDVHVLAADGNEYNWGADADGVAQTGPLYAAYALLAQLQFVFLHPLQPLSPPSLILPSTYVNITEQPRWPVRGVHYHTEHPLELTEVLNGFDSDPIQWSDMLAEVQLFFEWMVANKQNRFEYSLLLAADWAEFGTSALRQSRLNQIVQLAHMWQIVIGADVGLVIQQQHSWHLVTDTKNLTAATQQIKSGIDWLIGGAGYDYLSTESVWSL